MTRPINLRQFRKQRDRQEHRRQGDANAARFGEPAAERKAREAKEKLQENRHNQHKLDD